MQLRLQRCSTILKQANNIYFANNYSDSEPQLAEVRNAYKAKFKEDPINKVYLGYDKILVVAEAIKQGGSASADKILEGLNKVKDVNGTTGIITISPANHTNRSVCRWSCINLKMASISILAVMYRKNTKK